MEQPRLVVFFDGVCPLCVGWVKFLLDRDGHDRLRFASLQGDWAGEFFTQRGMGRPGLETVLVWDGEQLLARSAAVLALAGALPGIWSWARALRVIPENWRDAAYGFIASRRYRWFGRYGQCWLPDPADRRKFLDPVGQ